MRKRELTQLPEQPCVLGRETGRPDKLIKLDPPATPRPDLQQGDIVPAVTAGGRERQEFLMLHYHIHLKKKKKIVRCFVLLIFSI